MSTVKRQQRSNDLLGDICQSTIVHERLYYHRGAGKQGTVISLSRSL